MRAENHNNPIRSGQRRTLQAWEKRIRPQNVAALLYEGQISAALSTDAIPSRLVWTQEMWNQLKHSLDAGREIGPPDYPGCQLDVALAATRWLTGGETALVIGSVSPWLEAILLQAGSRNTVTLDIGKIQSEAEELRTVTYNEWAENSSRVDVLASFSTVEHFGLGRYGDKPSRDADINWMREFAFPNLKPNGIQFLAVPVAESSFRCDAHRIYGPRRLQRLIKGWKLLEVIFQGRIFDHIPFSAEFSGENWQKQPLMVLRREPI